MSAPSAPGLQQKPVDSRVLDRSLVLGIAWTSAARSVAQLLSWASTIIVARLLTPEDYGLVGMALIYLGLITLLSEFGLGAAVIRLRELNDDQVAQINGLSLLFGVGSFALSCAAAVPLGRFFHAQQLPAVIVAMSTAFVITAFKTVPFSLLQRELRFKTLALVEAGRAIVLAFTMVICALLGLRYWTLVVGGVLSSVLSTAATVALRRQRLAWPRLESLRPAMTFSGHILVGRLSWYVYSNADFLVAGRILGKAPLGLYELGWTLANLPIEKITTLASQVTPAVFAAVQTDHVALQRYLLRLTEVLAFVTFPASLGMALIAPDFVPVVLGDKWQGAVLPLQLLAVSTAFRAVTPLLPQVMNVIGESRLGMQYGLLCAVVLPAAFYIFARHWGTVGLAVVWVFVFPPLVLRGYSRVLKKIELAARAYFAALWPALSASLVMGVAVVAVRYAASPAWSRPVLLGAEVAVGAAVYIVTCLLAYQERIRAFRGAVRLLRGAGQPGPAA